MRTNQISLITAASLFGVSGCYYDKLEIDRELGASATGGANASTVTQGGGAGTGSFNASGQSSLSGSSSVRDIFGGTAGTKTGNQNYGGAGSGPLGGTSNSLITSAAAGVATNLGGTASTSGGATTTVGSNGGASAGGSSGGTVVSSGAAGRTASSAPPTTGGMGPTAGGNTGQSTGGSSTGGYVATGGSAPKPECTVSGDCKALVAASLDQCHQAACNGGKCQVIPSPGVACKSPQGANGTCTNVGNCSVCTSGDYKCEDKTLIYCPTSEADYQTACTGQICDAATHNCYGCQPGTAWCDTTNNTKKIACDSNGNPGTPQSSTDSSKPFCKGAGDWVACLSTPDCPNAALPICKEKSCEGNTCTSKNSAYGTQCTINGLAGSCDDAGGHCIVCSSTDKPYRCTGAQLEKCNADGSGYSASGSACASAALCSESAQQCLACDPAQGPSCLNDTTLRQCLNGGLTLSDTSTSPKYCYGGKVADCLIDNDCTQPKNPCQQVTCSPSTHTCSSSAINRSSGTGCAGIGSCNGSGTCIGPRGPSYLATAAKCRSGSVDCNESRLILGGSFPMGRGTSGTDAYGSGSSSEAPEHTATVGDFFIDTFEVTVSRFRQFYSKYELEVLPYLTSTFGVNPNVQGSGWQSSWSLSTGTNLYKFITGVTNTSPNLCDYPNWPAASDPTLDQRPMNCVNWYEAFAFCVWDGGRLPTEAEWEYVAAGASANRLYPWGQQVPDSSYIDTSATDAGIKTIVGSHPNGIGIFGQFDLSSSMAEWVLDLYSPTFYTSATCSNCANLTTGTNRVVRGGSVMRLVADDRAAARYGANPAGHYDERGIRCVRDAK